MNILNKIIKTKRKEIRDLKKVKPLAQLKKECFSKFQKNEKKENNFKKIIKMAKPFCLIAEIKLASPSRGKITNLSCLDLAKKFSKSRADIISILTDKKYFNGNIEYIKKCRQLLKQPIFRKDFIIDPYQVYETYLSGADAFLLIARVLPLKKLKNLIKLGKKLRLETIVEIHNKRDLNKAIQANAKTIGINNRNLKTMEIDLANTENLIKFIPKSKLVISESGINSKNDILRLIKAGAVGVLVGTSIVKSKNPINKIKDLKS